MTDFGFWYVSDRFVYVRRSNVLYFTAFVRYMQSTWKICMVLRGYVLRGSGHTRFSQEIRFNEKGLYITKFLWLCVILFLFYAVKRCNSAMNIHSGHNENHLTRNVAPSSIPLRATDSSSYTRRRNMSCQAILIMTKMNLFILWKEVILYVYCISM